MYVYACGILRLEIKVPFVFLRDLKYTLKLPQSVESFIGIFQ